MAAPQTARKESRSKRDKPEDEVTQYEQELAGYLQERIKPGLNRGSIPLLARSIAKEIAQRQRPDGAFEDSDEQDESSAEADVEPSDEAEEDHEEQPTDEAEDDLEDEPSDEAEDDLEDEPSDEAEDDLEDEPSDEAEDKPSDGRDEQDADDDLSEESEEPDFEAEMRELQAELGDDWILHFSVQGDEAWLTAEKDDGSQHVEGQTADLLREAVELLEEGGGRSG